MKICKTYVSKLLKRGDATYDLPAVQTLWLKSVLRSDLPWIACVRDSH